MDSAKHSITQQTWLDHALVHEEFSVTSSPTLLLQRLNQHGLKATEVIGPYEVNAAVLTELANPLSPISSIEIIKTWPVQLNWGQLIQAIEQLQTAWLDDYQSGSNFEVLFVLARCLTLRDIQNANVTTLKLQSFLTHVLSSITHAFDHHQYHFIQHFDLETHLPNQQLLLNLLQQYNNQFQNNDVPEAMQLGILMINLNINFEEASHHSQQLSAMSVDIINAAITVIKQHVNSRINIFRTSTQEIVLVAHQLKQAAQLQLIAVRLAHAFEEPLPLEHLTLILKPFFGGISSLQHQASPLAMLESAKIALHQAFFNDQQIEVHNNLITNGMLNQHQLDEEIIRALQENELDLYVQPLVSLNYQDTNTNEYCAGGEFLLRWQKAPRGYVSPTRLIDTIYKKGFGKVFTRWLIHTACRRCAELKKRGLFSFTLNLSSHDLLDEDLPELLTQSIGLWDILASQIIIEITETDLLANEEIVDQVLKQIVALGFRLALDDFGTGYSSMARLRNMPVNLVKIDQSFVRNIVHSKEDRAIVQSILELAHSLGKEVVAEGVEDTQSLNILKEMKCNKIQGYHFAQPMAFEDFIPWLNEFESTRHIQR